MYRIECDKNGLVTKWEVCKHETTVIDNKGDIRCAVCQALLKQD